jgi:hypothetical protein
MNIIGILIAAFVPLVIGFIWYNKNVFGKAWMKTTGQTEEKLKSGNIFLMLILTFVFGFFMALCMQFLVIHQLHLSSMLFKQPFTDATTEVGKAYKYLMDNFGLGYRTFKHGSFHGTASGILIALPIIAINALYERRGFKYVAIHSGYWIVCMGIMGGIVSGMV